METLLEALTQYAEENLVPRFLREFSPQYQEAELHAEQLSGQLKTLIPEAEEIIKHLTFDLDTISICREQAFLLSGVSIGLELGRFS